VHDARREGRSSGGRSPPLTLTPSPLSPSSPRSLQGGGEPRIWFLMLTADKDYPTKAPTIRFTSKVVMDCVDSKGNVSKECTPWCVMTSPKWWKKEGSALPSPSVPLVQVTASKIPYLSSWNSTKTMYGALIEVRNLLAKAPRNQPADGTNF
jgi:ubiquitin-protein ligase